MPSNSESSKSPKPLPGDRGSHEERRERVFNQMRQERWVRRLSGEEWQKVRKELEEKLRKLVERYPDMLVLTQGAMPGREDWSAKCELEAAGLIDESDWFYPGGDEVSAKAKSGWAIFGSHYDPDHRVTAIGWRVSGRGMQLLDPEYPSDEEWAQGAFADPTQRLPQHPRVGGRAA